jgi:hypothetical protein
MVVYQRTFSAWDIEYIMENMGLAYQSDKFFRLIDDGCGKQGRSV